MIYMFLSEKQLKKIGFASYGKNILISDKCSIYNPANIILGNNVRIDDFCILSAGENGIEIGNHVHIGCYSLLVGKEKITMKDYSGLSSRVSIYSSSDDFTGEYLSNPCVPDKYRNVISKPVTLNEQVTIGTNCTILPGVTIEKNSCVYAHSLVLKSIRENVCVTGVPTKEIKERKKCIYNLLIN
jgi:acetyltransferase-like isoleucine patch superfamily enzyme